GDGTFGPVDRFLADAFYVAIADLDGDGILDVATAGYRTDTVGVLRGQRRGHFAASRDYPAGSFSHGMRAKDLDGDGDDDVVVANYDSGSVSVLLATGTGGFV